LIGNDGSLKCKTLKIQEGAASPRRGHGEGEVGDVGSHPCRGPGDGEVGAVGVGGAAPLAAGLVSEGGGRAAPLAADLLSASWMA
jgi:hypothetical protein